jgi:hypothetical protein
MWVQSQEYWEDVVAAIYTLILFEQPGSVLEFYWPFILITTSSHQLIYTS